jgi:malate dehydrogenase
MNSTNLNLTETTTLNVCVTGAAGNIANSFIPLLANGLVFGPNTKIKLSLLDISNASLTLEGVILELEDCVFPLLVSAFATTDPELAFKDCDVVVFIGGFPRREGMERKDLLQINGEIFKTQGLALEKSAKKTVRCLVVANPANTNCYILHTNAPSIPKENFSCLTRLDHNRALGFVARKLNAKSASDVKSVIIWGNHSSKLYPQVAHCQVNDSKIIDRINNEKELNMYFKNEFISKVQKRGAEIIFVKGTSSILSAANAIKDHLRDWYLGTSNENEYVSMGVVSKGEYNIPEGLVFSFPVICKKGFDHKVVSDLNLDKFDLEMIGNSTKELLEEKNDAVI